MLTKTHMEKHNSTHQFMKNSMKFIGQSVLSSILTLTIIFGGIHVYAQSLDVGPDGQNSRLSEVFSQMFFGESGRSMSEAFDQAETANNVFPLNGNVGIGTQEPTSALHIAGNLESESITLDGETRSSWSDGAFVHNYGTASHGTTITPPNGYTKDDCSFMAAAAIPEDNDGAYKRSRHYSGYWEHDATGWTVYTALKSIRSGVGAGISGVPSGTVNYILICS